MSGPLASVFLPSYNKPGYAPDAARSVLAQDYPHLEFWVLENSDDGGETRRALAPVLAGDPRVIYEEIGLTPAERSECYVTSMLLNRYYGKANGTYIFYVSDDDMLDPGCVSTCVAFMEEDPGRRRVCYFGLVSYNVDAAGGQAVCNTIPADRLRGLGSDQPVDCAIDGGQIAHRKDCLDAIGFPWFPENPDGNTACHADGLFMKRLAEKFTFWPVKRQLVTARHTPQSTWNRT